MASLRQLRVSAGMRPAEVAQLLGVNASSVLNWEYGISRPRPATLGRLARLHSVDITAIDGLKPAMRETPRATRPALRAARMAAGLTILALAHKARVHPYTVRAWESGTACPRRQSMDFIASALRVEPATLDPECWKTRTAQHTDSTIGAILRRLRQEKGLTQREVAEAVGVSQGVVAHWENGRCAPSPRRMGRLAALLGDAVLVMSTAEAQVARRDEKSLGAIRRRSGMSQRDVARFVGVARATVGHWETGRRRPSNASMDALAALFNISADGIGLPRQLPDPRPVS
jgi:transcriptional regulator with XRE-family HTH domain